MPDDSTHEITGTRTATGKRRTSLTAFRDEYTGQTNVLPSADVAPYQRHCKEFHDEYNPKGQIEIHLTQMLASLSWRRNRVRAIEANLLSAGMDSENDQVHNTRAMAKAFREHSRALNNLSVHESRLSNCFRMTLKQLHELQSERLKEQAQYLREVPILTRTN